MGSVFIFSFLASFKRGGAAQKSLRVFLRLVFKAVITLITAKYPDMEPIRHGCRLIMSRQKRDGSWPQESIEGGESWAKITLLEGWVFRKLIRVFGWTKSSTRMRRSVIQTSSLHGRSTRSDKRGGLYLETRGSILYYICMFLFPSNRSNMYPPFLCE